MISVVPKKSRLIFLNSKVFSGVSSNSQTPASHLYLPIQPVGAAAANLGLWLSSSSHSVVVSRANTKLWL